VRLGVSTLAIHTPGGIGRYARILAASLLLHFDGELHLFVQREGDLEIVLQEMPDSAPSHFRPEVKLHISPVPSLPRHLQHQWLIPRAFNGLGLDAYLDPDYILPLLENTPCTCVVHDTTPYSSFQMLGAKARLIYGLSARPSLNRAQRIVCVSEHTRAKLAQLFPRHSVKMRTVTSCLSPRFEAASRKSYRRLDAVSVQTEYGPVAIPQPFILHVGVPGPRKNIPVLLEAFKDLKLRMFPHRLVLVGGKAQWFGVNNAAAPVPQAALSAGMTSCGTDVLPEVLPVGRVSDDDLISLYRHADLLVLPSLEEGFGYPVLEALAFRTPALAGSASPLAKLPGVATIPNPASAASVAEAMEDALRGLPELAAQMAENFHPAEFSCERYVQELLAAIAG
jgi:glycosyltransferase involved in cell wall biosynthesis